MRTEQEILDWFYADIEKYLDEALEKSNDANINSALVLHDRMKARPYCIQDFEREEFHKDLIKEPQSFEF